MWLLRLMCVFVWQRGHKAFIDLEYAKFDPNLHTQLFAKHLGQGWGFWWPEEWKIWRQLENMALLRMLGVSTALSSWVKMMMWSHVMLELKQHARRMNNSLLLCAVHHWFVTVDHAHCSGLIVQSILLLTGRFATPVWFILWLAHNTEHRHTRQSFWWFEFILYMYNVLPDMLYLVCVQYVHVYYIIYIYIGVHVCAFVCVHACLMFLCHVQWWCALPLDVSPNSCEVVYHLPNNVPLKLLTWEEIRHWSDSASTVGLTIC